MNKQTKKAFSKLFRINNQLINNQSNMAFDSYNAAQAFNSQLFVVYSYKHTDQFKTTLMQALARV